MTVEDSRVHGTELFGISTRTPVKLSGFYKLAKARGNHVYIIDPEATLGRARASVRELEKMDRKNGYSLVEDIGFVAFSSDTGDIEFIHDKKIKIFAPLFFSPEYIKDKFPKLIRSRKTVEELVHVAGAMRDFLDSKILGVGNVRIDTVKFEAVRDILVLKIGKFKVTILPGGVVDIRG